MAITTCNLASSDARARVVDLITRYDDEDVTIAELKITLANDGDSALETCVTHTDKPGVDHCCLYLSELIEVYERRKLRIAEQLSKLGISMAAIDEQPSQSPVLDAAVRAMNDRSLPAGNATIDTMRADMNGEIEG